MEYNDLKQKIVEVEKDFDNKSEEARKSYNELIEKNFYSMRDKVVDMLKDVPQEEIKEWLDKASKDNDIEPKTFMLVQVCWKETHKNEPVLNKEEVQNLAKDLALFSVLRRLL